MSRAEAIEYFSREAQRSMGPLLAKLILYGSAATGEAGEGSDIDIAVIHFGSGKEVLEKAAEISFEATLRYGETIEAIPVSVHEFRAGADRSFFLREIRRGRVLYEMDEKEALRQEAAEYLALARDDEAFAGGTLERGAHRAAVDLGSNAAELLVKALILVRGEPLARAHSGIAQQFGRLYVLRGGMEKAAGTRLRQALILRGRARYDPRPS